MQALAFLGLLLFVLGVLSRILALALFRRISASSVREVTPSILPATPWFTVESDRAALKVIVYGTYASVLVGMILVLAGVLA